jgi:signal transduction histidine kinase
VGQSSGDDEETDQRLDRLRERVEPYLAAYPNGGPLTIGLLGAVLFLLTLLDFFAGVNRFGFQWQQVLAIILGTWLASIIVYGGLSLSSSDFSPRQRWQVAAATVGGLLFLALVVYFAMFLRTAPDGRPGGSALQLLASAEAGAIAGLVIGILYVRVRQDARDARRTGQQLEFMHSICRHDVLNSMMVVQARAEFLENELDGWINGQHEESLDAIVNQAESVIDLSQRARATVNALATETDREPEPVELGSVLREEVATVRASYDGVRVRADIPEEVTVRGDDMLAEVFGNLLGNAVQHNDAAQPAIRVSVDVRPDIAVVRIADNGPGVPDDLKDEIFERGHSTTGGGFGLFFVRTMIDHYGGDVRVEDAAEAPIRVNGDGETGGAVFVVELPRMEATADDPLPDCSA